MNIPPQTSVLFTAAFFLAGVSAPAQDFHWDSGGANTKYEAARNWGTDILPYSTGKNTMFVDFSDGGTMTFNQATGIQSIDYLNMSHGSVLNMTGGFFDHARSGNRVRTTIGFKGKGSTVNQSGGKMRIGHILKIGDKRASGSYNLSGGVLDVYRGGLSLMGAPSGPSLSIGPGGGEAEFNISGGSLETRVGVEIDTNASFNVLGNDALFIKIGSLKPNESGFWYQKGTLSFAIGFEGVTKVEVVNGTDDTPQAQFLLGSKLDLSFNTGTKPVNGTWTLLELENAAIIDEGLVLSDATKADQNWSFKVDNSGQNGRLIASYGDYVSIPEPLSCSLILGTFSLFVLNFRRRGR